MRLGLTLSLLGRGGGSGGGSPPVVVTTQRLNPAGPSPVYINATGTRQALIGGLYLNEVVS